MSEYVVLIHDPDQDSWLTATDEEKQVVYDVDLEFGRLLAERGGKVTGGRELSHGRDGRVLRKRDQIVSEGPFAETAEVLNGFYIVECDNVDTVVELARVLTRVHDVVEIRPVERGS